MQDLLRRPLVPLEFTEENKKVALVNELLMDKNNFVYIKRADGSFPSIQDIIIEYLGGSMVFRGFVDTRADLDEIDIDSRAIGDMYIVRVDETYKDPEDNTNIEYIVMEDTIDGEKVRYWECLGNPFVRGIDEEYPIYGSTKLITSGAIYKYGFNFVTNIEVDNDNDVFIFTKGFQTSPDGTLKPIKETIGTDRHRKVETRPNTTTKKYITATSHSDTYNDVLLFDSGVYIGTTAGELNSTSFNTKSIVVFSTMDNNTTKVQISPTAVIVGSAIPTTLEKSNLNVGKLSNGYRFSIVDNNVSIKDSAVSLSNISQLDISSTGNVNISGTNIKLTGDLELNKIKIVNTDIFTKDNTDLQLNYNIGGVKIGKSQSESKLLGNYTFGEELKTNSSTINLYGKFNIEGVSDSATASSIYKTLNISNNRKNDTNVTITPINSNGDMKETASFNYDYTKFKNNVQIYGSNNIYFLDDNDSTKLTINYNGITIHPTSSSQSTLTLNNNSIFCSSTKFTIYNPNGAIAIGDRKSDNISIGYLNSNGSIFDSSSSAIINLNGKVVLRDTTTVDPSLAEDINDLYGYLAELKKSWSEGLQSLNSALTIVTTGGLDKDTEASNITDLNNKIKYLRPISKHSSDNSNIFYSTINGSNYRRSNITLSVADKEIKATMSNQLTKNDMTTYTAETVTAYTFDWLSNRLCYKTVEESKYNTDNYIESITNWTGNNSFDPNISTDKTIITAGRYYFPNDIVVKSIGNTHSLKESIEILGNNYCDISNNILYMDIPLGLYYKTSNIGNNKYAIGTIDIDNIPLNSDVFGNAAKSEVLSDKTFTSSNGRNLTGSMTNNGAKTAYLNCSESYTIPKGYHNGSGIITANSLSSQTSGTATAANILSGKTAWVKGVQLTGTMADNSSLKDKTLNCGKSYTIPKGYHNGSVTISANSLSSQTSGTAVAANILDTKTAWVNGDKLTGTMANNGTVSSSLNCGESYTIPAGYHDGSGKITANSLSSQTSANAVAANILKGKTAWVNGSKITGTMNQLEDYRYHPNAILHIIERNSYTDGTGTTVNLDKTTKFLSVYEGTTGYIFAPTSNHMILLSRLGEAVASHVLDGDTFTSTAGLKVSGTMANNGAVSSSLNCGGSYTIPAGYHDGSGKITANSLSSQTSGTATDADILSGKTAWVNGDKLTGAMVYFSDFRYVPNATMTIRRGKRNYTDNNGEIVSLDTATDFLSIYEGGVGYIPYTNRELMILLSRFGNVTAEKVACGETFTSTTGLCSSGTMKTIYSYSRILSGIDQYQYLGLNLSYGGSYTRNYTSAMNSGQGVIILFKLSSESASGYPLHAIGGTIGNTIVYESILFDLGSNSLTVTNNRTDVSWIQVSLLAFGNYYSEWW